LIDYWANHYDWRKTEARLNNFAQFRTEIDGLNFHFLHVRSPQPDALPMIMSHGWARHRTVFRRPPAPGCDALWTAARIRGLAARLAAEADAVVNERPPI
jgi:hypothetical protein